MRRLLPVGISEKSPHPLSASRASQTDSSRAFNQHLHVMDLLPEKVLMLAWRSGCRLHGLAHIGVIQVPETAVVPITATQVPLREDSSNRGVGLRFPQ
jgi:hypothetical protein